MMAVRGDCIVGNQEIAANITAVYKNTLKAASRPYVFAPRYKLPLRLATSDKAKANVKAEAELAAERGPTWSSQWHPCDIHTVAGAHTKTAALVEADISYIVNMCLSVAATGMMRRFRQCIVADVAHRLEFVHGRPPIAAAKYKERILDLFMARGPDIHMRRMLVHIYLSGGGDIMNELSITSRARGRITPWTMAACDKR